MPATKTSPGFPDSVLYKLYIILWVLCALLALNVHAAQPDRFSAQEVKADFHELYATLQSSHVDLYAYTDKSVFDQMVGQIDAAITDSYEFGCTDALKTKTGAKQLRFFAGSYSVVCRLTNTFLRAAGI